MTVKELKEILNGCADDDLVMISSDSEGNSVSPMMDAETGVIGEEYTFNIEGQHIVLLEGQDFACFDFEKNKGKRYIKLYPTLQEHVMQIKTEKALLCYLIGESIKQNKSVRTIVEENMDRWLSEGGVYVQVIT